jgi:hypothetical protein
VPTGKTPTRRRARTRRSVRDAAQRAVDRLLSSEESFALLIRRLQDAGWRIERPADETSLTVRDRPR